MIYDFFKMLYWLIVNICFLIAQFFKLLWRLVTS